MFQRRLVTEKYLLLKRNDQACLLTIQDIGQILEPQKLRLLP